MVKQIQVEDQVNNVTMPDNLKIELMVESPDLLRICAEFIKRD